MHLHYEEGIQTASRQIVNRFLGVNINIIFWPTILLMELCSQGFLWEFIYRWASAGASRSGRI